MKKFLTLSLILLQIALIAETKKEITSKPKSTAVSQEKAAGTLLGKDGIKRFSTLKEAAEDYAKVLQEVSNYGSREMLKTINPSVDKYVQDKNDNKLSDKWEKLNTMLIEQFEVSVHKISENQGAGEVVFLVKGYNEEEMGKYLNDNLKKYATINKLKAEVDIDIEKYIDLQYSYLMKTKKINLATSTVNFAKDKEGWKVVEGKRD